LRSQKKGILHMENSKRNLFQKYNIPVPRYTSYPTVPFWDSHSYSTEAWAMHIANLDSEILTQQGISLYIHLPFCESLCTFCGCNKRITKNHNVEDSYIESVLKEWSLYLAKFQYKPLIKEIHLGGGTPTFFSPENLKKLIEGILQNSIVDPHIQMSLEGHPNHTSARHLQTLFDLGFRRISYGVQDYDPVVQKAIHRIQPFEQVQQVTNMARTIGFSSISHDLVFGLPFQTLESIENSIGKTLELAPDRISFYSYAHVPWIKGTGQRGYSEDNLPKSSEKRALYERGKVLLESAGYLEIGFDHFALPNDDLFQALQRKSLHRNFMGYTTAASQTLIGLGVSAISDGNGAFSQNVKVVEDYENLLSENILPAERGHFLTDEDKIIQKQIMELMCKFETSLENHPQLSEVIVRLQPLLKDNLAKLEGNSLKVMADGIPFVRNICLALDAQYWEKVPKTQLFSSAV